MSCCLPACLPACLPPHELPVLAPTCHQTTVIQVETFLVSFRSLSLLTFAMRCVDESSGSGFSLWSTATGMASSMSVAVALSAVVFVVARFLG